MIIECIKEGLNLTHKNWQLVLLRIGVAIINIIGFLVFIGLPIFVAILYLGMDITHLKEVLPSLLKNPFEFVSRYLRLVILIGGAFIFYMIFSFVLFLYLLSGTLGVLKGSVVNIHYKFSFSSFLKEGRKYFFTLLWLISLLLVGFIIIFIIFAISGGIGSAVIRTIGNSRDWLRVFLNSFFILSIIVFGIIGFFLAMGFIVYSITASVVEGKGVIDAIKKTYNFLKNKPLAFLFYFILLVGVIIANLLLLIVETPFTMIDSIKPFIDFVFYVINVFFQSYLSVVLWSSLVIFYIKNTNYSDYHITYDI